MKNIVMIGLIFLGCRRQYDNHDHYGYDPRSKPDQNSSTIRSLASRDETVGGDNCSQCQALTNQEACAASISKNQDCFSCFTTADWCKGCSAFYPNLSECSGSSSSGSSDCSHCQALTNQEACAASISDAQPCFHCFTTEDWCKGCSAFYPNVGVCSGGSSSGSSPGSSPGSSNCSQCLALTSHNACAASMSDAQPCFHCFTTEDWCAGCRSFYPNVSACFDVISNPSPPSGSSNPSPPSGSSNPSPPSGSSNSNPSGGFSGSSSGEWSSPSKKFEGTPSNFGGYKKDRKMSGGGGAGASW
jgi:hypothetical protein